MGRRGPAPTPTGVKLRNGETRPSRVNRLEPLPRHAAPAMPRGLDDVARKVWRRVVREMGGSDVILAADADVLRCYVEAVSRYARAAQMYAASTPLVRRGGELVKNPLHQVVVRTPTPCACSPVSWASHHPRGPGCGSSHRPCQPTSRTSSGFPPRLRVVGGGDE